MKNTIVFLVIIILCRCNNVTISIPSEMNKKIVVSYNCNKVIFSSNERNYFTPYLINNAFSIDSLSSIPLIRGDADYFSESISCDCNLISLVSENLKYRKFDVFTYNILKKELINITNSDKIDESYPSFSPKSYDLAFLSNFELKIYNYQINKMKEIDNPKGIYFKNFIWSENGKVIFLEDYNTNIWKYRVGKDFNLIWKAPKMGFTPRMITPLLGNDSMFYFLSDHASNFTQIYKYISYDSIQLIIFNNHDKYLLQRPINEKEFYYRENINGNFLLKKYINGKSKSFGPAEGVVYDYYHSENKGDYILYADKNMPASLFLEKNGIVTNIANISTKDTMQLPRIYVNDEGMYNLVYQTTNKQKGWIVWLHGGPYEQVSIRYNTYLFNLLKDGWNILVLNYPGSTGIGNDYELRNIPSEQILKNQVIGMRKDLYSLMKIYPTLKRYSIIGVSYGSVLAHCYVNLYSKEVISLIDFSGIANIKYPITIPTLYIYGEYDFSLQSTKRVDLIKAALEKINNERFILSDEGHVINHKKDILAIIKRINSFLTKSNR